MIHNNLERLVDREKELDFLNKAFYEKKAHLIVIYGRRRVGKSFLLKHFTKDKKGIYYLCTKGNETEQLSVLSKQIGDFFDDTALKLNPFNNWHNLFLYIYEKAKDKRLVLIIDEFPFLVQSNNAISSIINKYWEEYLSKSNIFVVLCGSSISMMESETMDYKAPLYGRRTGQWKLNPLKFKNMKEFFDKSKIEDMIRFYAVTGGIAFYLNELDLNKDIIDNIKNNILRKEKILYEEGEMLIKEELKDSMTYMSILNAIANGSTKQGEIANKIKLEPTSITRHLSTLQRLNIIKKELPVTEPKKSKKALYKISDNFLDFWFRFVYPNKIYVEEFNEQEIDKSLKSFNHHTSKVFENICKELLGEILAFTYEKSGRWWGYYREQGIRKELEIDIAALNENTKEILFGECKWSDNVDADAVLKELKEKAKYVDWNNDDRKEHYAVFARSFKRKIKQTHENIHFFDLKYLEKLIK